jgi:hypothetical protein
VRHPFWLTIIGLWLLKFGPALGDFIRELHESNGAKFHLGQTVKGIDAQRAQLDEETTIDADLVLIGIGVRPRLDLAERAGLAIEPWETPLAGPILTAVNASALNTGWWLNGRVRPLHAICWECVNFITSCRCS